MTRSVPVGVKVSWAGDNGTEKLVWKPLVSRVVGAVEPPTTVARRVTMRIW